MSRKPPTNTYYMGIDREGRLLLFAPDDKNQGGLPMALAARETAKAFAEFGRSEGLRRAIYEVNRYLQHADLEGQKARIVFNSKTIELPDGQKFEACASCGHSPAAERAFWDGIQSALKQELANPPRLEAETMATEDMPQPEGE